MGLQKNACRTCKFRIFFLHFSRTKEILQFELNASRQIKDIKFDNKKTVKRCRSYIQKMTITSLTHKACKQAYAEVLELAREYVVVGHDCQPPQSREEFMKTREARCKKLLPGLVRIAANGIHGDPTTSCIHGDTYTSKYCQVHFLALCGTREFFDFARSKVMQMPESTYVLAVEELYTYLTVHRLLDVVALDLCGFAVPDNHEENSAIAPEAAADPHPRKRRKRDQSGQQRSPCYWSRGSRSADENPLYDMTEEDEEQDEKEQDEKEQDDEEQDEEQNEKEQDEEDDEEQDEEQNEEDDEEQDEEQDDEDDEEQDDEEQDEEDEEDEDEQEYEYEQDEEMTACFELSANDGEQDDSVYWGVSSAKESTHDTAREDRVREVSSSSSAQDVTHNTIADDSDSDDDCVFLGVIRGGKIIPHNAIH